ncbi:hypothetical protein E2986_12443 [Frieseomelitta varia]|uniref:Uncharacterized protein n=1 Tax=Frieseomelitta varia TaxID=561572 RepID=A0A833W0K0_9HYME|nr:hypothetical protein E2986_12443 [Frieseomelitta varia]
MKIADITKIQTNYPKCTNIHENYEIETIQEPRFTTQPSSSGNILSENRTKFLQCQARDF